MARQSQMLCATGGEGKGAIRLARKPPTDTPNPTLPHTTRSRVGGEGVYVPVNPASEPSQGT